MKKVYIVGGGNGCYRQLFLDMGMELVPHLAESNLVVFTGGADVSANLYGDKAHATTGNDPRRDAEEEQKFLQAMKLGIPMVGICRGGQFLNVMSGGRMYQHVTRHCGDHDITDLTTGETLLVSSTHHQMMMPSEQGQLVASSHLGGSREWYDGEVFKRDISDEDIEVVYYEHTNCLCFQPHPEFDGVEYAGMKRYFADCLAKFLVV